MAVIDANRVIWRQALESKKYRNKNTVLVLNAPSTKNGEIITTAQMLPPK